ncbi:MAG: hypothetical protein Q9M94_03815 [Candidatus Gracilibacteria bacterium]|nr:hypothetical protein [Candidatus Gracilibacteria bacterium]
MKKILVILLALLSFSLLQTNAGELKSVITETVSKTAIKAVEDKYDYEKSYKLFLEINNLVKKYYYSMVFDEGDESEKYIEIEEKIKKLNEYSKLNFQNNRYSKEVTINEFLSNSDNQEIINALGYHSIRYNSYNDSSINNSLFIKEHNIDLSNIKLNDKIDGIYLGMKINRVKKQENDYELKRKLPTIENNNLKNIYTKDNSKEIDFQKIDLKSFDGKINVNISKLVKNLKSDERINVQINLYIKKGDFYISFLKRNINDYFSFDRYTIKNFLDRKHREETNPRGNPSNIEKLEENLNNKLKTIFDKIKLQKTEEEYISFLETVKTKIITFSNDREKYDKLIENIKDDKSYNIAYKKYKKLKDQEKVVNILLVFISNEILENTLEETISDFIK